jgi:hypothetical protein
MDSEGSLKLPSVPALDKTSLLQPENADSLRLESRVELGSSLFRDQVSTSGDGARPHGKSTQEVASKAAAKTSPQKTAIQAPEIANTQFVKSSGQPKQRELKADVEQFCSMKHGMERMMSSLEPEDGIVPHYIRLYRKMIVKCVDCTPLLPQMRDIFDDQGGYSYFIFSLNENELQYSLPKILITVSGSLCRVSKNQNFLSVIRTDNLVCFTSAENLNSINQ